MISYKYQGEAYSVIIHNESNLVPQITVQYTQRQKL